MSKDLAKPNIIPSRRVFIKSAAALGAGGALLVGINDGARADGEPIPVGQAAPLTDFAAADGVEFKNGLTLACEEINALGGILGRPLEPYFEDTKQMGDATNVQAVQRLIDRHSVHAILNGSTSALAPRSRTWSPIPASSASTTTPPSATTT